MTKNTEDMSPLEAIYHVADKINSNLDLAGKLLSSKPELNMKTTAITDASSAANQTKTTGSLVNNIANQTNTTISISVEKNEVSIGSEENDKPFNPSLLYVKVGDIVIWKNNNFEIHKVTSSGNSSFDGLATTTL